MTNNQHQEKQSAKQQYQTTNPQFKESHIFQGTKWDIQHRCNVRS